MASPRLELAICAVVKGNGRCEGNITTGSRMRERKTEEATTERAEGRKKRPHRGAPCTPYTNRELKLLAVIEE